MEWLAGIELWLIEAGPVAWIVAPLLMTIVAIVPFPAEAPAMMNGMVFGAVAGSAVTWTGGVVGAWISFELARKFGRPLASKALPRRALTSVDDVAGRMSWPGLIGLRLLPVVAFTAVNWGAGLTTVPRSRFLWTTAVGILPGAILFSASGAGLPWLLSRTSAPTAIFATLAAVLLTLAYLRIRATGRKPETEAGLGSGTTP